MQQPIGALIGPQLWQRHGQLWLKKAPNWLTHSGYKPDMFVALDVSSNEVWYGALRIDLLKFLYTAPSVHTLSSRGTPSPAKALAKGIDAVCGVALPPLGRRLRGRTLADDIPAVATGAVM